MNQIDPNLCTHIIYSFVGLQTNNYIYHIDPPLDLGPGEVEENPDDEDASEGQHGMNDFY